MSLQEFLLITNVRIILKSTINRGRLVPNKEKVEAIEAVNIDDLIKVNKNLLSKKLSLTAVGKTEQVAKYSEIEKMFVG